MAAFPPAGSFSWSYVDTGCNLPLYTSGFANGCNIKDPGWASSEAAQFAPLFQRSSYSWWDLAPRGAKLFEHPPRALHPRAFLRSAPPWVPPGHVLPRRPPRLRQAFAVIRARTLELR